MNIKYIILILVSLSALSLSSMTRLTSTLRSQSRCSIQLHKPVNRSLYKTLSVSSTKKVDLEKPKLEKSDMDILYPMSRLLDLSPENVKKTSDGALVITPVRLKQYPYKYNSGKYIYCISSESEAGEYHDHIGSQVGVGHLLKNDMTQETRDIIRMYKAKSDNFLWLMLTIKYPGKLESDEKEMNKKQ